MKSIYYFNNEHRLHGIFLLLAFVLAWIATHPYSGIWHDGALYLSQALLKMNPSVYGNDVFFKFGSQDSYSVFSGFYVFFINILGIENAAMILLVVAQIIFVGTLWMLCIELYGRVIGMWAACSMAMLSAYYGGDGIFSYAEMFFTARSIAEPLCILALYFLLRQRPWVAAGLLLGAGLFHPLITLPVLFVWWLYQSFENKKYWYLALGVPAIFLLAVLDIQPFQKILQTYDDAWWDVVFVRNGYVIPLNWTGLNWILFGIDCFCIYLASRVLQGGARRLMLAVLAATVVFMLASIVGTTPLRNVLITSLQLWRIDWVTHFLAMAAIPHFVVILWRKGGFAKYSAIFLVLSGFLYPTESALTFMFLACAVYILHRRGVASDEVNKRLRMYLNAGVVLAFLFIIGQLLLNTYALFMIPTLREYTDREKIVATLFEPTAWKTGLVIAWVLFFVYRQRVQAIAVLLACLLPLTFFWDQRTAWQKYITQTEEHPFKSYVSQNRQVYWHDENILASWVLLDSVSYYSKTQGAGALFNRGTAIELYNRAKLMGLHQPHCFSIQYSYFSNGSPCVLDQHAVRRVCQKEPGLDAMIFPFDIKGLQAVRWSFGQEGTPGGQSYWLYPCSSFRKS